MLKRLSIVIGVIIGIVFGPYLMSKLVFFIWPNFLDFHTPPKQVIIFWMLGFLPLSGVVFVIGLLHSLYEDIREQLPMLIKWIKHGSND